jgi:tetratricopeptide (TPR) repeat protein/outer membrane biosynthesis protein TonB
MADPTVGLDRSVEPSMYSPVVSGPRTVGHSGSHSVVSNADLADDTQSELASLIKRGAASQEAGNYGEAEEVFRKALVLAERTLGPEHPALILLLNDLTRLYLKQSAYGLAEPLLLRLLDLKRSKGENHPEVATVLASLATVRQGLGRHESAEQLWRRVVEIRERTLAPNHFATAIALEHLGDVCAARGKIREALSALGQAQMIRERTLGSEHPSLQVSRERIADLELQGSEDSLDDSETQGIPTGPDRYRLLSGDPIGIPTTAPKPRAETPVQLTNQATLMIPRLQTNEARSVEASKGVEEGAVSALQTATLTYRDALETIRDEMEDATSTISLGQRSRLALASVIAFLSNRYVGGAGAAAVIALLVFGAVAGPKVWGGGQASGEESPGLQPIPSSEGRPIAQLAVARSASPAPDVGGDALAATVKQAAPRPRVVEEKSAARKPVEKKQETKAIAIPTISTSIMNGLDAAASRAGSSAARGDIVIAPASTLGAEHTKFEESEQNAAPLRARLIGELPTPKVSQQIANIEGSVRVQFTVDTEGHPVMSTFAVAESPSPMLSAAVRNVIPGMRFEPARTGGANSRLIADVVWVTFRFARPTR